MLSQVLCFCNCACTRKASPCCCFEYDDPDFPPMAVSVGPWKDKSAEEVDKEIEWKRGNEICSVEEVPGEGTDDVQHIRLFSDKIEPSDIGQGQLGDCWLMTALACLSEFPGAIQNIFETDEYNPRGRYVVRLYCGQKRRWESIVVDDHIPVKRGTDTPIFAKPNGKELWVALLEKAFAKFVGNYQKLDGGFAIWGLQAMTGDQVANWMLEEGVWKAYEIRYRQIKGQKGLKADDIPEEDPAPICGSAPANPDRADKNDIAFYRTLDEKKKHLQMQPTDFFDQLCQWDQEQCVIAASTSGKDEGTSTAQSGLVQGHAYSVIECKKIEDGHTYAT
jgi:calpain-15